MKRRRIVLAIAWPIMIALVILVYGLLYIFNRSLFIDALFKGLPAILGVIIGAPILYFLLFPRCPACHLRSVRNPLQRRTTCPHCGASLIPTAPPLPSEPLREAVSGYRQTYETVASMREYEEPPKKELEKTLTDHAWEALGTFRTNYEEATQRNYAEEERKIDKENPQLKAARAALAAYRQVEPERKKRTAEDDDTWWDLDDDADDDESWWDEELEDEDMAPKDLHARAQRTSKRSNDDDFEDDDVWWEEEDEDS